MTTDVPMTHGNAGELTIHPVANIVLRDPVLAKLAKAGQLLVNASREQVQATRCLAKAAETYAKERGLGKESQRFARTIILEADRRLHQILSQAPKNKGEKGQFTGGVKSTPPVNPPKTLAEKNVIGWTRDSNKRCDYVLWLWQDTHRFCLLPFPMLCKVMQQNWEIWIRLHKVRQQHTPRGNRGYHSECVFVPRRDIWVAIYNTYSGKVIASDPSLLQYGEQLWLGF